MQEGRAGIAECCRAIEVFSVPYCLCDGTTNLQWPAMASGPEIHPTGARTPVRQASERVPERCAPRAAKVDYPWLIWCAHCVPLSQRLRFVRRADGAACGDGREPTNRRAEQAARIHTSRWAQRQVPSHLGSRSRAHVAVARRSDAGTHRNSDALPGIKMQHCSRSLQALASSYPTSKPSCIFLR